MPEGGNVGPPQARLFYTGRLHSPSSAQESSGARCACSESGLSSQHPQLRPEIPSQVGGVQLPSKVCLASPLGLSSSARHAAPAPAWLTPFYPSNLRSSPNHLEVLLSGLSPGLLCLHHFSSTTARLHSHGALQGTAVTAGTHSGRERTDRRSPGVFVD